MFIVYAIYNSSRDKIYIGQTSDLLIRLKRHNGEIVNKKRSYTNLNSGKWETVHQEKFNTRKEALIREKQLKSQKGREFV